MTFIEESKRKKTVLIVGSGFSGMTAGVYAQLNGYQATIVDQHTIVGGMCTCWKRKGYTVDGCCHFLLGSSQQTQSPTSYHQVWSDIGIFEGVEFNNYPTFMTCILPNGDNVKIHTNPDLLENELMRVAPEDADLIRELTNYIRIFARNHLAPSEGFLSTVEVVFKFGVPALMRVLNTLTISMKEYARRAKSDTLREILLSWWEPEWVSMFTIAMLAALSNRDCGQPIGGSQKMSDTIAKRFRKLGGEFKLGHEVVDLIIENDTVKGVYTQRGTTHFRTPPHRDAAALELRADRVIWAADPHVLLKIIGERYTWKTLTDRIENCPTCSATILCSYGLNSPAVREQCEGQVMGISPFLSDREALVVGDQRINRLWIRAVVDDPSMTPGADKSLVQCLIWCPYDAFTKFAYPSPEYDELKGDIAQQVAAICEKYLTGFRQADIEMTDIVTPHTLVRYTDNTRAAICAFRMEPQNTPGGSYFLDPEIPGLKNIHVGGSWMTMGGGLPTSALAGRLVVRHMCKEDKQSFKNGPLPDCFRRNRVRRVVRATMGTAIGIAAGSVGGMLGWCSKTSIALVSLVGASAGMGTGRNMSALLGAIAGGFGFSLRGGLAGCVVGGLLGSLLSS